MSLQIELRDEEQQKTYRICVSDEEYNEIIGKGNIALATRLLIMQKEKEETMHIYNNTNVFMSQTPDLFETPHVSSEELPIECPSPARVPIPEPTSIQENTKLWSHEATLMLIQLCGKYEKEFQNSVKKYVWQKIAKELSQCFNQKFEIQQCDTKFKGLKHTYKTIKKHNEESGNNRKEWKYFDQMNELLFSRPEINSPATCSSRVGLHVLGERTNILGERTTGGSNVEIVTTNSEIVTTPSTSYQSSFIRKRKLAENANERRHKEKMARQDRYLDLLERLTKAVEGSCSASHSYAE
ncbi:uncharacterized protein LOC123314578 [Coccinella septempunctata]|uniref:uncharacterized protein LOC123306702 n=1 Tax=Coccinella septempunctata TaxID=41139 RepID=UPI001D08A160|nr:uncharacterized protein LOC123306702 [Coccinella septempunctata]XP_044755877.1 uncharacterized protein LOC123314578 [Coccinella septempunctata]